MYIGNWNGIPERFYHKNITEKDVVSQKKTRIISRNERMFKSIQTPNSQSYLIDAEKKV